MLYFAKGLKMRAVTAFLLSLSTAGIVHAQDIAAQPELKETVLEKPANVIYPSSLQKWQDQSIGHVEQYALNKRDRLFDIARNGKKYFPSIVKTFSKYELPEELKVLIVLESDFNPNVISWAGAVGYWQFMDETAREYGLNIITKEEREAITKPKEDAVKKNAAKGKKAVAKNKVPSKPADKKQVKKKDDRKNLVKSTKAAARYLGDSYKMFGGDLLLTVASYNCGPGNVKKAQQRSGIENAGFWDIKECLPAETCNYVMNFIALNVMLSNYTAYQEKTLRFRPETVKITSLFTTEQPSEALLNGTTASDKNK